jgi:diguanylate cyclase
MKPEVKKESEALKYARQALITMTERGIEPTPTNYSVWYHYIAGDIKELNEEIDKFLKTRTLKITDDVNIYLFNKYIQPKPSKEEEAAMESASQNAQIVLSEIMEVIKKFSSDTETYNTQIDTHVNNIAQKITDPALKEMANEIINQAVAIRNSGSDLNSKLQESKQEVVQLKENLHKATSEANKDFLTGIGNRKALEKKLEEFTQVAKQENGDLCLLMIDIDHFKTFNDRYGHLIGDEVLKKVSKALFESIKGKDFVARYGGEEFAILLPHTPLAGALILAENIRKDVESTRLLRKDTNEYIADVTISIGVARYRTEQDSVALLISRADSALYRSKIGGRNRVTQESF